LPVLWDRKYKDNWNYSVFTEYIPISVSTRINVDFENQTQTAQLTLNYQKTVQHFSSRKSRINVHCFHKI